MGRFSFYEEGATGRRLMQSSPSPASYGLFRMLARGEAPPSYRIGKRRFWREPDVIAWLEDRCLDDAAAG